MPSTARKLRSQLGLDSSIYGYIPDVITNILPTGQQIGKASPLFKKIEDKDVDALRNKYAGKQETTSIADPNDVKSLESQIAELVSESVK